MTQKTLARRVADTALSLCGYRALPGNGSNFGSFTGYPSQPWDGSLVTFIMSEAGVDTHPFTDTSAALAHYSQTNRLYRNPQVGDVVVYGFSVTGRFGHAHIGVVTDVTGWKNDQSFRAVEGMVASGLPRASTTPSGVFERTRYSTDVLAFIRPKFRVPVTEKQNTVTTGTVMRTSYFAQGAKAPGRVELLQRALAETVGLREVARGRFDSKTKSAYASWQRRCGKVGTDANGVPDVETLQALGARTALFTVRD